MDHYPHAAPATHRVHDYRYLTHRWRAVARSSGIRFRTLSTMSGYKLHYLKSPTLGARGGIYISAGIHGDEPAGVEGLISWAERNVHLLSTLPCLLFPCLNPWGLVNNRRFEETGEDLNRLFHKEDHLLIQAMRSLILPHHFEASLMLHEDYDGQGFYLYETELSRPFWGERLVDVVRPIIPIESRPRIDGRKPLKPGIVRRKIDFKRFAAIGLPEAVYLHVRHSERAFTIETPSEFSIDQRVAAQIAVIDQCVRLVLGENVG